MGEAAKGKVKQVSGWHVNAGGGVSDHLASAYLERFPEARDDLFFISTMHALEMLVRSIDAANTTEVQEVARQLETMTYEGPTGVVSMRADNHQLLQPLYISTFVNVEDEGLSFDIESTGIGPKTDAVVGAEKLNVPTTCVMERP
jgi:branched-chain amino acid transport system substrate-binding protein